MGKQILSSSPEFLNKEFLNQVPDLEPDLLNDTTEEGYLDPLLENEEEYDPIEEKILEKV